MRIILIISVFLLGCAMAATSEQAPTSTTLPPTTTTLPPKVVYAKLSWENTHPERSAWSRYIYLNIKDLWGNLSKAQDMGIFCPKYSSLSDELKIQSWAELIVGIAYYESGWKPNSWMTESTMGTDPVTGKQVKSEGFLQLSYQDVINISAAKECGIDWSKDKGLSVDDLNKTIFSPEINLRCGIRILADQVRRKGKVVLPSSVYWSVIKEGGKYQKISSIATKVQTAMPVCK